MLQSAIFVGGLCLIIAELLFAGVGALVKHLSLTLSHTQLVFFRNLFALIVLLPWLQRNGISGLRTAHPGLHLFRSVLGLLAMYCFFMVLANMPLAPAMMALLTAPFIVPIVARVWLKEAVTHQTVFAMLIGFVGVAAVLQPGSMQWSGYAGLAVLCAVIVAINKCSIRKLSETEPSARIVFYFTFLSVLVSAIPLPFDWHTIAPMDWLGLAVMGGLAGIGQLLMTKAFQLASPVKIGLLTYSSVVFAAFLGYTFWGEPISQGLIVGTLLIIWAANITLRQRWFL
ncbi:DMT family transporter [Aestuariibacter halophilus]|uniref:DMT family transporter n=1 Tax=Fluctibacter halophilus TaxID=226011 RepID=A0ABS8G4D9_9ALTE|nr:DMT family transporter [Aestuariibacter halophilus]MCC2615303.1 DMT family transporter [Aestuariibacter halophilus]